MLYTEYIKKCHTYNFVINTLVRPSWKIHLFVYCSWARRLTMWITFRTCGIFLCPMSCVLVVFYICLFYFYSFPYSFHFSENVTYTPNLKMFVLHGYCFISFWSITVIHIWDKHLLCLTCNSRWLVGFSLVSYCLEVFSLWDKSRLILKHSLCLALMVEVLLCISDDSHVKPS